jgi:hypothetical protein
MIQQKRSIGLIIGFITLTLVLVGGTPTQAQSSDLIITGVIDGPLTGGLPKAVEFYVRNNITNLSSYGFGSANNGGGSDGQEFTFPAASVSAGAFIYVATEATGFSNFFGFAPTYINQNAPGINGDDAIELFQNGAVVDVFGNINVDGTGQPWEYTDGWAYRKSGTGPDGSTFGLDNWSFSGPDALDGAASNASAGQPFPRGTYSPGSSPTPTPTSLPAGCGTPATLIHAIQGSGLASPLVGQSHTIEGVVVGDFQNNGQLDNGDLRGFYLQEEANQVDADPQTSEGIFVFEGSSSALDVSLGQVVRVQGSIAEFNGLTELTSPTGLTICSSTGATATPATVSLPVAAIDDLERYEGMAVAFPQPLFIAEFFNFDRFNEMVLTSERQFQPTAIYAPGSAEAAQLALANRLGRITLDDGRTSQNPDPLLHPNGKDFGLSNAFRGGDGVQNLSGVMDYAFGLYRVQPVGGADFMPQNLRPAQAEDVGGDLTVASFNVLNYFTTLDYPTGDPRDNKCGPLANQECRGADADQPSEFERQRDKIIAALTEIEADVAGLIEIENHPGDVPTADLVSGLNEVLGSGTYAYIPTGAIGGDAIRVALIYKPAAVTPLGSYAILDSSVDSRFLDNLNRPVLAQTFQNNNSGGIFTVAVNHLKSKGSDCNAAGDPDRGDGAGNCNLTRKAAAEALVDWLATDPTTSGDPDFLIMGDLNSYDKEEPIKAVRNGADDTPGTGDDYTDLVLDYLGEFAYSYLFDGQLGYLDHALANQALLPEVTGTTVWHINADEPDILDYDTTFKPPAQDALYEPNAYRSSDHDPVMVGLEVCDEIAPLLEVTASPAELWPANHKYVNVAAAVSAVDNFDPNPAVTLLSVGSNEPDDGLGDGDTPTDIVIVDDYNFQLRAERSGNGEGRVYTITYQATDRCGNATVAEATVNVPRDQGNGKDKDKDTSEPEEAPVDSAVDEGAGGEEEPTQETGEAPEGNGNENQPVEEGDDEPQEADEGSGEVETGDEAEVGTENETGQAGEANPENGNQGQGNGNGPDKK